MIAVTAEGAAEWMDRPTPSARLTFYTVTPLFKQCDVRKGVAIALVRCNACAQCVLFRLWKKLDMSVSAAEIRIRKIGFKLETAPLQLRRTI